MIIKTIIFTFLVILLDTPSFSQCSPSFVFMGQYGVESFGSSVSSAGDFDNDGFPDILIGSQSHSPGGAAFIFSGGTGDTLFSIFGANVGDALGRSVSLAGDVNSDGHTDIIVGSHLNDYNGVSAGAAFVISGFTGDTLFSFYGEMSVDWFGFSVAHAGDVNSDGFSDLIVGALRGNQDSGAAYVFSGSCTSK
jgi:hypothetical protein